MSSLLPTSLEFLQLQAARMGERGGIVFGERQIHYPELARSARALADWLAKRGIGAGDHVAIMAANVPSLLAMYYAVWGIGAVAVPLSARSTVEETTHLLDHSRAGFLLCDEDRIPIAREAASQAEIALGACAIDLPLRTRLARRGRPRRVRNPALPSQPDLASITYTSGTTGSPKGVMITHGNFLWSILACAQARSDRQDVVAASISPLTHTPVLVSHVLCRILLGSTIVLFQKFDTETILTAVERYGITDLPLIAGMVFDIIGREDIPESVTRSVEKVTVGGAPTPMAAKRKLAEIFSRAEVIEAYGQSESTDGVAMARGTSVFDREGTIGRPNPHLLVRVARPDGQSALPDDEGEIVIGGPTLMQGYFRNPKATADALQNGWLHTGDLGRQDADGYLYLTGRVKDLIITGGENVAPREVEDVLRQHPEIADVAVIGTPHPKWGEQVTAVIVREPNSKLDAADIAAFSSLHLSGFKKPRRVEFVDELPRNAARKVAVSELKQRFT